MKNIVLIGFMGSGKTVVAAGLSKILGMKIIDTDKIIEAKERKKIKNIFKLYGEEYFRKIEADAVKFASRQKDKIISTGGGVVINPQNIKNLKRNGIIIYLKNTFITSFKRLKDKKDRPLFNIANLKKARLLFKKRLNLYKKAADIVIKTDDKTINEVVSEIIQRAGKYLKCRQK